MTTEELECGCLVEVAKVLEYCEYHAQEEQVPRPSSNPIPDGICLAQLFYDGPYCQDIDLLIPTKTYEPGLGGAKLTPALQVQIFSVGPNTSPFIVPKGHHVIMAHRNGPDGATDSYWLVKDH